MIKDIIIRELTYFNPFIISGPTLQLNYQNFTSFFFVSEISQASQTQLSIIEVILQGQSF